jgi:hypothetical protein
MVVSGEVWRLFKETHPERDFSDFWLEVSLNFSINSFDLSTFFLLHEGDSPAAAASNSPSFMKKEPLSPTIGGHGFSFASDIVESGSRDLGHVIELSY